MPIVTIQVRAVNVVPKRIAYQQFKDKYEVWPTTDTEGMYQTWNPWLASLCQRAQDLNQPITLWTRDTKYGPEIIRAELQGGDDDHKTV